VFCCADAAVDSGEGIVIVINKKEGGRERERGSGGVGERSDESITSELPTEGGSPEPPLGIEERKRRKTSRQNRH
jgi:hypothetical protein